MANWEQLAAVFPQGIMVTPDNQILSIDDIKNNEQLEVVTSLLNYTARNMVYKQEEWAWGKNGEFAIASTYDVNDISAHMDNINPLNVYAMTMLYDYLALNNLTVYEE